MPLTHDDLINARDMLAKQNGQVPTLPYSLISNENFKKLMYLAKNYKTRTQFIKRNRFKTSKKERYRKTFLFIPIEIINEKCLKIYGTFIVPIDTSF